MLDQRNEEEKLFLAPLYVFLSSSLNIELVYIILKSITKFAISRNESVRISGSDEHAEIKLDMLGNAVLELSNIKVKNYQAWSRSSMEGAMPIHLQDDTLEINEKVTVTYYKMREFQSTFK